MALVEWREEFSVGLPAIDHEHRELIDLVNAAHAGLGEAGAENAVAGSGTLCLSEIHARISTHFALEEKIMREAG